VRKWKPKFFEMLIIWLRMIPAKWRVFCGFCPSCNSDAPAIDDCQCCESYGCGQPFPPSAEIKHKWLEFHKQAIHFDLIIKSSVAESRKARKLRQS